MLKKEADKKVRLGVRCGDCVHYDHVKKHEFGDVCVKLGIREKANAPDCFSPNVYKLNSGKSPDVFGELSSVLKKLRPSQLRILAFTLTRGSTMMERHGFTFGQTVYFSLGHDYLSHYFKGYVIGGDSESVIIASKLKNCPENTIGYFLPDSLLTRKEFSKKKKSLVKKNRIVMTDADKGRVRSLPLAEMLDSKGRWKDWKPEDDNDIGYEPPTLETAPPEWFDKVQRKTSKSKKNTGYIPMTSLADIPQRRKHDKPTLINGGNKNFEFDSETYKNSKKNRVNK